MARLNCRKVSLVIITTEDVVNTILNINEDDDLAEGEGVPADALVMVKQTEDGKMYSIDSLQFEPETNTLWVNVSEY